MISLLIHVLLLQEQIQPFTTAQIPVPMMQQELYIQENMLLLLVLMEHGIILNIIHQPAEKEVMF